MLNNEFKKHCERTKEIVEGGSVMKEICYLLWNSDGWGVYSKSTCPDPDAFPDYCYKKYEIDIEKYLELFEKLIKIKERLVSKNILPSRENYNKIFPKLEELLK